MARNVVVDPARAEQSARARWAELDAPPPPAVDADGRKIQVEHGDRLRGIEHRARVIAASDGVADAVLAHLAAAGVDAESDQVRVDPHGGDDLQVMAIRVGGLLVPLRPASASVRLYAVPDPAGLIELAGDPVAVLDVEADDDGWVSAERIAAALAAHLAA
ncbi:hypothetical protein [Actinosynnema sp. NPDC023587]|uniref:hypothetical protein n=1 Tax=Actinosynnema sp. NPDC023587 TaxID=3154695 RepID=UPI00340857CA